MDPFAPDLQQFVDQEIARGNFADRNAVIEHALRMMKQDREEAITGIKSGLDDVAAGRSQPLQEGQHDIRSEHDSTRGR